MRGLALALALAWSAGAWLQPVFRSDAPEFFVYLPSLAFDHDLDFSNDWIALGYDQPPPRTSRGLPGNKHPIGPALLWSPCYLAAHAYVVVDHALGGPYLPSGYAPPYRRSVALGTLALVVLGERLAAARAGAPGRAGRGPLGPRGAAGRRAHPLLRAGGLGHVARRGLRRRRGAGLRPRPAAAGALARRLAAGRRAAGPGDAHALAGPRCWPWPSSPWPWRCGASGRLRVPDGLLAVGAALLTFAPQMLAWRRLYGSLVTMPQGGGFVDWSSPHLLETLFSADHGLFTWTPLTALGLLGLLALLRREGALAWGALLACAATAWVNGGVDDWAAGEAFGARRYDVALPFLGLGLGQAVRLGEAWGRRRPWPPRRWWCSWPWPGTPAPPACSASASTAGRCRSSAWPPTRPAACASAPSRCCSTWPARGRGLRLRCALGRVPLHAVEHQRTPASGPDGGARAARLLVAAPAWPRGRLLSLAAAPEGCLRVPLAAPMDFPATLRAQAPQPSAS